MMLNRLMDTTSGTMIVITIGALVIALIYLLPALLAFAMGHPHPWGVLLVDLVLGWTIMGWIAALVWALWQSEDGDNFDNPGHASPKRIEPTITDYAKNGEYDV
ncbi:superinfection immunity protein [Acidithiobacillus sp. MC6.1]|nr:superinfection immunity protein [Acidithiobacillus sp. MC6.1]